MRDLLVIFDVLGDPTPQGSKTKMPGGVMVEGGSREQRDRRVNWRNAVADKAREAAAQVGCLDGDLHLVVVFRFPMPKSRPKAVREAGRAWKNSAPDLDKLVRSLGDSLTHGGLITDDARLVHIDAYKVEVWEHWTGAIVSIRSAGVA